MLATTAQGEATTGGTYREALIGTATNFNPLRGSLQTRAEADVSSLLFDGLTRVETTGSVIPDLAERWQVDPLGLVYTVTLRPEIRWHDNVPFSADDVIWTIDWLKDATFTGDPLLTAAWQNIAVTSVTSQVVRFNLPGPYAPFLNQLALPILPAHVLKNATPEQRATWDANPIGTGVYKLESVTPTEITLVTNPLRRINDQAGQPNLERLTFKLYPTIDDAHMALRRSQVDALSYNVTERPELATPAGFNQTRAPLADYVVLTFNLRDVVLGDVKVRQAMSYAVDAQALINQALGGKAIPLTTPILPSSWAWNENIPAYVDDANHSRAIELLDAAGWKRESDGFRYKAGQLLTFELLTSNAPERITVGTFIQQQLATVGISTTLTPLPADALQNRLLNHDFTLAIHGWSNLGSDPDVYELWHSSQVNAANFAGLSDQTIDDVLVQARQTDDIEERKELYDEFQARWLALAPSVMLYQPLLEQQTAPSIQTLGLAAQASQSEVLYRPSDRFRRVANWYQVTTRQVAPNIRRNPTSQRPR